jgi:sterol desaturase/sphingolipid hydroxylase (fatty acid hydroxylase superfamily)
MSELWSQVVSASQELVWVSIAFFWLSLILKGKAAIAWIKRSLNEARLNIFYYFLDVALIAPIAALIITGINYVFIEGGLSLFSPETYEGWPILVTLLFCITVSDFVGYWRHRLLHTRVLWPVHSVHHSDTEMTWTTLARFHPLNRFLTIALNAILLSVLGVPPWAIALNGIFRHYYGYYVHGDFPWSYGPLRYVFVSPVMHRWHHVREIEGSGSNFATVFSLLDVAFGTFYMPERAMPALGITEPHYPTTWVGQTIYPFRIWARRLTARSG